MRFQIGIGFKSGEGDFDIIKAEVEADRLSYAEARPEPCSVLQRPAHDTMTGLEAPAVRQDRGYLRSISSIL